MALLPYQGQRPGVHPSASVSPDAAVIGKVVIGPECSVWQRALVRGDQDWIRLGRRVSLGENCTVHVDQGNPTILGDEVVVEGGAVIHGCVIESRTLVEAGARVLSGSHVGSGSIVRAGTLVAEGAIIPPRSVVAGVPGKVQRQTSDDEVAAIVARAREVGERARALFG